MPILCKIWLGAAVYDNNICITYTQLLYNK